MCFEPFNKQSSARRFVRSFSQHTTLLRCICVCLVNIGAVLYFATPAAFFKTIGQATVNQKKRDR